MPHLEVESLIAGVGDVEGYGKHVIAEVHLVPQAEKGVRRNGGGARRRPKRGGVRRETVPSCAVGINGGTG